MARVSKNWSQDKVQPHVNTHNVDNGWSSTSRPNTERKKSLMEGVRAGAADEQTRTDIDSQVYAITPRLEAKLKVMTWPLKRENVKVEGREGGYAALIFEPPGLTMTRMIVRKKGSQEMFSKTRKQPNPGTIAGRGVAESLVHNPTSPPPRPCSPSSWACLPTHAPQCPTRLSSSPSFLPDFGDTSDIWPRSPMPETLNLPPESQTANGAGSGLE
ncbi:hypothetical protein GALMADRAFT_1125623 [Galerina marginata CBS 339.88]|uniref:Uncharacterized protein n=1 Tax=Galerina marginata (strain CBS 339.88) TaxID=685588 RepID=A0A067TDL1_GALM3|nr:hypothetical protein GALMADRAFT_1125623 [Galerina marginata CBS 339.88]